MASLQQIDFETLIPAGILTECVMQIHASIRKLESLRPSRKVNSLFTQPIRLEYNILKDNDVVNPKKVAFIGSGSMPLTSIVLAMNHMKSKLFDNFDIDESVNHVARQLVGSNHDLEKMMKFETMDVVEVSGVYENLGIRRKMKGGNLNPSLKEA
ncbi:hypothetical protein LguiB_026832 [Lonicera macranthoides]